MLVINAGAHKSGSTWLEGIVRRLPLRFDQLPLRRSGDHVVWLNKISQLREPGSNLYVKYHFSPPTDDREVSAYGFIFDEGTRLLNILRDFRDVLVSSYFHHHALHEAPSMEWYFENKGRAFFNTYVRYNGFWVFDAPELAPGRVLNLCYEALKTDFASEVGALARFLDIPDEVDVHRLQKDTSLTSMRVNNTKEWMRPFEEKGSSFYRKGEIGDFENHLTDEMISEIDSWMAEERFQRLDGVRRELVAGRQ